MLINLFRWRKVGQLSELWCFPIKSCGAIALNEMDCGQIGPQLGNLRDRVFMVTHDNGEFITARTYPRMLLITPTFINDILTLSAPGMDDFKISIKALIKGDQTTTLKGKVWKDYINCIDCGEEAGRWMSKFIQTNGLRLVYYPTNEPRKEVSNRGYKFQQADDVDTGAFHDETR
jgi:uncharacterized protein YcbX